MTQSAAHDELLELKDEMQVLKNLLGNDEIVSDKMLTSTMQTRIKNNTQSRRSYLLGIATGIIIIAVFVATYLTGTNSLWFAIVSIAWGVLCTAISAYGYALNTRETLLSTPLTDSVEAVLRWKKQMHSVSIATTVGVAIWVPCLMVELWGDLTTHIDHAVFVFVLIGLVLTTTYMRNRKTFQAIDRTLEQLRELKRN